MLRAPAESVERKVTENPRGFVPSIFEGIPNLLVFTSERSTRAKRTGFVQLIWLASCAVVVSSLALQPGLAAADPATEKLREALAQSAGGEEIRISVVLRKLDPGISRARHPHQIRAKRRSVLSRMNRGHYTPGHRHRWLSGFSGWADAEAIEALLNDPEVVSVDIDHIAYASLAQGTTLVGATSVQPLGVTGSGVTVAVLDSGIDTDHPNVSGNLIAEACFCDDVPGASGCCPGGGDTQIGPGAAEDDNGHGTENAGIIVSNAPTHKGVAPDASIVAVKVLNATGSGNFSDIARGLDWVIDNRLTYGIKVVNLSLGDLTANDDASAFPCTGSNTANAIAQLRDLGVSVFVAAGNNGFDNGIAFPACTPEAISVGGVYDAAFSSVSWCGATCSTIVCTDAPAVADSFVCSSNSGSLLDVLAPQFQATVPTVGGGMSNVGGTSISSPYAAGQAALLLDADATLAPNQVLTSLEIGAPLVTNPDNGLSFPRTRVDLAVAQLLAECGNGLLEAGEACDDNNTSPGDCCDESCQLEETGSSCNDSDACTITDVCDGAGTCVGSGALACDDSNVCTDDSCLPASGCLFDPNTAPCNDSNACTTTDLCVEGICASGSALDCDDLDECTADGCDAVSGCFHEAIEGCPAPPMVPALPLSGLVLLAGTLLAATLWTFHAFTCKPDAASKPAP